MTAILSRKWWMVALLMAALFVVATQRLKSAPRQTVAVEMQVALPLFVQVFMAMGDRNLAANIAAIRAIVVATDKMRPEEYAILGKVQKDVSWLNPAHEDNYYVAFAVLPAHGEVDATQVILARAGRARYFDYQPSFFYAFNQFFVLHDVVGASAWLREAAEKLPDDNERLTMQNMAARWIDKADDVELAIRVVEGLAKQAKRKDFRDYLDTRVKRLHMLQDLRSAADRFQERNGHRPGSLDELTASGIIGAIPQDPFGFGFEVDARGQIFLRTSPPRS